MVAAARALRALADQGFSAVTPRAGEKSTRPWIIWTGCADWGGGTPCALLPTRSTRLLEDRGALRLLRRGARSGLELARTRPVTVAGAWHLDCWVPEQAMVPEAREAANLWPACAACFAEKAGRNGRSTSWSGVPRVVRRIRFVEAFIDEVGDWFTRKLLGLDELTGTK